MHHPQERMRAAAALWGLLRVGLGTTALFAPHAALRPWVGTVPDPAGEVLGRALGGRDIALGAGTAVSAATGRAAVPWIVASGCADAADAVLTLASRERLPRGGRDLVAAASAGSALASVVLATGYAWQRRRGQPS
ncbi:MAG: hypothetical protein ACODAF_04680 [Actinomycetota bacterium]